MTVTDYKHNMYPVHDVMPIESSPVPSAPPIIYADPIPANNTQAAVGSSVYVVPETPTTATSTGPVKRPTTTNVPPPHATTSTTTSNPPPGVPDGGQWITIRHTGGGTWAICGVLSIIGCFLFLFPCGLFALCCPCDEKDAYVVNQKVFDHNGHYLGPARRFKSSRRHGRRR